MFCPCFVSLTDIPSFHLPTTITTPCCFYRHRGNGLTAISVSVFILRILTIIYGGSAPLQPCRAPLFDILEMTPDSMTPDSVRAYFLYLYVLVIFASPSVLVRRPHQHRAVQYPHKRISMLSSVLVCSLGSRQSVVLSSTSCSLRAYNGKRRAIHVYAKVRDQSKKWKIRKK